MTDRTLQTKHYPPAGLRWLVLLVACGMLATFQHADAQVSQNFDHFSTGFALDGAHGNLTCESCHTESFSNAESIQTACMNCPNPLKSSSMRWRVIFTALQGKHSISNHPNSWAVYCLKNSSYRFKKRPKKRPVIPPMSTS